MRFPQHHVSVQYCPHLDLRSRLNPCLCTVRRLKPGETWTGEMVIRSYDTMWQRPLFDFDASKEPSEAPPPASEILQRPTFTSPDTYG